MGKRIWRAMKLTLLGLFVLIFVLIGSGLAYRAYRHHEIAKATVIDTSKGIDEAGFVKIGGIEQWMTIRGQDRENPVVLLLHGGTWPCHEPLSARRNLRLDQGLHAGSMGSARRGKDIWQVRPDSTPA